MKILFRQYIKTLNEENSFSHDILIVILSYAFILIGAWNDNLLGLCPTMITFGMEYFLAFLLLIEVVFRFIFTKNKNQNFYLFVFIDILSVLTVIPGILYMSFARLARLFVNGFKILKILDHISRKTSNPYYMLYLYPLVIPMISALLYAVEKNARNVNVHNYFDALYMAFSYSLTIGLSSHHPVTMIGNIICGGLLLIGFMIVAVIGNTLSIRYSKDAGKVSEE